jgi:hypothetical protein
MSFLPRRNGEAEGRGEESWVWLHRLSSASLRCLRFSAVNLHRPGLRLMNEFLTTEKRRNGGTRRRILGLTSPAVLRVSPLPPLLRGQSFIGRGFLGLPILPTFDFRLSDLRLLKKNPARPPIRQPGGMRKVPVSFRARVAYQRPPPPPPPPRRSPPPPPPPL